MFNYDLFKVISLLAFLASSYHISRRMLCTKETQEATLWSVISMQLRPVLAMVLVARRQVWFR